jgi:hypothetical protein
MAKRTWLFLINTFEVNTAGSNVKMLSLATDTHSKLQAQVSDPVIAGIMASYDPVYQAYRQICTNYDLVANNREGETLNFETLMRNELPIEIRKWEGAVRSVYYEDSPQEKAIFPNKRAPFLEGTYEDRIIAINVLYEKLATDSNFATLAVQVQSFYNVLLSARDSQQQQEGTLGLLSNTREQQRILMAVELYGALGALMNKYKANPETVAQFFDLSILRETGLEVLTNIEGNIAPNAMLNLGLLPDEGTVIRFENKTDVPLEIGLSEDGTSFSGNTSTLGSVGTVEIKIADLISAGNIVMVKNQSNTATGSYKVQVLG